MERPNPYKHAFVMLRAQVIVARCGSEAHKYALTLCPRSAVITIQRKPTLVDLRFGVPVHIWGGGTLSRNMLAPSNVLKSRTGPRLEITGMSFFKSLRLCGDFLANRSEGHDDIFEAQSQRVGASGMGIVDGRSRADLVFAVRLQGLKSMTRTNDPTLAGTMFLKLVMGFSVSRQSRGSSVRPSPLTYRSAAGVSQPASRVKSSGGAIQSCSVNVRDRALKVACKSTLWLWN